MVREALPYLIGEAVRPPLAECGTNKKSILTPTEKLLKLGEA